MVKGEKWRYKYMMRIMKNKKCKKCGEKLCQKCGKGCKCKPCKCK